MDAYPGKTVVLMDVDCRLRGDIEPVTQIDGDVGIVVIARNVRRRRRWAHWLSVECSSRVVVFRPTDGARAFARTWADTIEVVAYNRSNLLASLPARTKVKFTGPADKIKPKLHILAPQTATSIRTRVLPG